jgi:hypothetical protein
MWRRVTWYIYSEISENRVIFVLTAEELREVWGKLYNYKERDGWDRDSERTNRVTRRVEYPCVWFLKGPFSKSNDMVQSMILSKPVVLIGRPSATERKKNKGPEWTLLLVRLGHLSWQSAYTRTTISVFGLLRTWRRRQVVNSKYRLNSTPRHMTYYGAVRTSNLANKIK